MSLFHTLSTARTVNITIQDQMHRVPSHLNVAAALLLCGYRSCRNTPVSNTLRAPYCMMGVCFECLVEIDGLPNQQACLTMVYDGMVVCWQSGKVALNGLTSIE